MSDSAGGAAPSVIDGLDGRTLLRMQRCTYTVSEVAELLGISRSSAYECVRRGKIPALTLGRRLVVPRHAIDTLLGAPSEHR